MTLSFHRSRVLLLTFPLTLAAIGCGAAAAQTPVAGNQPGLTVVAVARDLAVGSNRLPIAVLSADGQSAIEDQAQDISIRYGRLENGAVAEWREIETATWRKWPTRGVYVTWPEFDSTGFWQIQVTLDEGGQQLTGAAAVEVKPRPSTPRVGEMAPEAPTKTATTVEEARLISSAAEPDPDMYSISLGAAVRSGKPVLALFSTPAFCVTQTCGPQLEVVESLQDRYGDRVHFVHVEIWDNAREMLDQGDPAIGRTAPAVDAWGLQTEPFTFLVDAGGRIFAKFEAFTTEAELEPALTALTGQAG